MLSYILGPKMALFLSFSSFFIASKKYKKIFKYIKNIQLFFLKHLKI